MATVDLQRIVAWCAALDLPAEPRGDAGLWIVNPAAPAYGVLVRELAGPPRQIEWSLALAKAAGADRVPEVERALAWINATVEEGGWELDPASRTVRFALRRAATDELDDAGLMDVLRTVIEQGNSHVHALIEVIDGREPAGYVAS